MKKISQILLKKAQRLYHGVFPKKLIVPDEHRKMLTKIYPTVNWKKVRLFKGMPWFMGGGFATGITLPGDYSLNKIEVFLDYYIAYAPEDVAILVHEGYHVLQYEEMYKNKGIGFFRPFLVHYLAGFFKGFFQEIKKRSLAQARNQAYRYHPMEIPAYDHEALTLKYIKEVGVDKFVEDPPLHLVVNNTGYRYNSGMIAYFFAGAFLLLCTLFKPIIELFYLLFALILFLPGKLLQLIGL